jgi:hypothetical protein
MAVFKLRRVLLMTSVISVEEWCRGLVCGNHRWRKHLLPLDEDHEYAQWVPECRAYQENSN